MPIEKPKILVVDDDRIAITIILEALGQLGRPVVAKSGEQALARAAVPPLPDLILLDVNLPDMDGYDVCRKLKENTLTRDIPVVFVSSRTSSDDLTTALAAGGADFIPKPIHAGLLQARVQQHLAFAYRRVLHGAPVAYTDTKPLVMLVDDQPFVMSVVKKSLGDGYEFATAETGEAALSMLENGLEPDLILLDVVMPGMSGYDLCRKLKASNLAQDVPIIFVSVMGEDEDEFQGLELGAIDYLVKPISPAVVRARVRNQLALHHALRDLTRRTCDLQLANRELISTMSALKRVTSNQRLFLGTAAHDLRAPLASMSMLLEMVEKPDDSTQPMDTDLVDRLRQLNQHMLYVVDGLLTSDMIESGELTMDLRHCDIGNLAESVVLMVRAQAEAKNQQLHMDIERPCTAMVDAVRICEVIENLLTNAIKFSPADTSVSIQIYADDEAVTIHVKDEGPGIQDDDLPKLYGKFARLSTRPTAGERSTGLGLYLTKRFVELHGGNIAYSRNPDAGSCFTVSLLVSP